MIKAAAVAALVLGAGAAGLSIFGEVLGPGAEAAAMALGGGGLWAFGLGLTGARTGSRGAEGAQAGAQ